MQKYKTLTSDVVYRLIGHGPLVLVSTTSSVGKHDLAPIAWNCPVNNTPTQILLAMDKSHQTYRNIMETRAFIVCVPTFKQVQLVKDVGSVTGQHLDKFKRFTILSFTGNTVKSQIPQGCLGYIECKLIKTFEIEDMALTIGEYLYAAADEKAFNQRVLPETAAGKTLHHLGGKVFATLANEVL